MDGYTDRDLINQLFIDDASEGAAYGLLALMTGISEEFYCAGWMMGLEFALWQIEGGAPYGMGTITDRQALLLKELAAECGGWWMWSETEPVKDSGPVFVRTEQWLEILKGVGR